MVSRLKFTGERFKSRFSLVRGPKIYGQLLELPDTSRVSNFISARRYLRTGTKTPVILGDILIVGDTKYIVADHGDGFMVSQIYKHFKLFEVDEIVEWYKVKAVVDPITGIKELDRKDYKGQAYLSTQPTSLINDSIKIPGEQKIAVCSQPVNVDDKLGSYLVTKVDKVLGVYVVTLKVI